jgi:hypothetical protein
MVSSFTVNSSLSPFTRNAALLALGLLALGTWLVLDQRGAPPKRQAVALETPPKSAEATAPSTQTSQRQARAQSEAAQPGDEPLRAREEAHVRENLLARDPPETTRLAPKRFQPHPDSAARNALLEQRLSFEQVKAAIDRNDYEEAGRILSNIKQTPDASKHWEDRFAGYRVLIACGRDGDFAATEAARNFITKFSASPLRRLVKRSCLLTDQNQH